MAAVLLLTSKSFWRHAELIDQPSVGGRLQSPVITISRDGRAELTPTPALTLSNSVQAGAGSDSPEVTSAIGAALADYLQL